jgi:putative endonuclease
MLNFIKKLFLNNGLAAKKPYHLRQGKWGENQAVQFLRKNGYRIIARNIYFRGLGELDIIASSKKTMVFIEVKTRKNTRYGRPVVAVGRKKRERIERAAVRYLKLHHRKPLYIRFDVIEVIGEVRWLARAQIVHLENVFTLSRDSRLWW